MNKIILNEYGERFFNKYCIGGNKEVMLKWLPKINEEYKKGLSFWESVVSVVGSSHLGLFKIKEMKGGLNE